jgi:hypothetical protein
VGGFNNVSSGQYSVSGGRTCVSSGNRSVAFNDGSQSLGTGSAAFNSSISSGTYSSSFGSNSNSSAQYSLAMGIYASAYLYNGFSHGSSDDITGNKQYSNLISYRDTALTTGGTTTLSLDGTGVTNLIIPNGSNRMWNVQVRWVAVVTAITGTATGVTVGDTKTSTDLLAVAKRSGTTTVSAHTSAGTHAIETIAGSLTAANITYSAGASQEMAITFTGPTFAGGGSVTMRVVAAVSLTEVAF